MGEESSIGTSQQGAIASIGGGKGVDLSTSDLGSFTPQGMEEDPYKGLAKPSDFEAYNKSFYQPPVYGNDTLYPGMGEGIGVGNFSSQTTGSQTIYAPTGQYMPYDILQKREKALADAARLRQERLSSLKLPTGPKLNDPYYQRNLDNQFIQTVDRYKKEAQSLYGDNWQAALLDPTAPDTDVKRRFQQDLRAFDTLKTKTDILTDKAAEVLADDKNIYGPEEKALAKGLYSAINDFAHGDPSKINATVDQLKGTTELSEYLHKNVFPDLEPAINEWEKIGEEGDFEVKRSGLRSSVAKQAEGIAKQLKGLDGKYRDFDFITEESIKKRIMDQFGAKVASKTSKTTSAQALKRIGDGDATDQDASIRYDNIKKIASFGNEAFDLIYKTGSKKGEKASGNQPVTYLSQNESFVKPTDEQKALLGKLVGGVSPEGKVSEAKYVFRLGTVENTTDKQGNVISSENVNKSFDLSSANGYDLNGVKVGGIKEFNEEIKKAKGLNPNLTLDQFYSNVKPSVFLKNNSGTIDGKPVYTNSFIDLSNPQAVEDLNGIMNTSPSEKKKIESERLQTGEGIVQAPKTKVVKSTVKVATPKKEVERKMKDGKIAIFDANTKQFLRYK